MKRVVVVLLVGLMFATACAPPPTPPPPDPPVGNGAIQIEQGRAAINRVEVELQLTIPTGATQVRIANGTNPNSATWQAVTATRTWQLPGGDGTKTVSAQFRRGASIGAVVSDTIQLDTVAPEARIDSHRDGDTVDLSNGAKVEISGRASDAGSGVADTTMTAAGNEVEVGFSDGVWAAPLGAADNGVWPYEVTVTDLAGNNSSAAVTLTVTVPAPGVTIVRPGVLNLDASPLLASVVAGGVTADAISFNGDRRGDLDGVSTIVSSPVTGVTDQGLLRSVDSVEFDPATSRTRARTSSAGIFDVYAQLADSPSQRASQRPAQRSSNSLDDRCSEFANEGTVGESITLPEATASFPVPFPVSNYTADISVEAELAANLDAALEWDLGWSGVEVTEFRAVAGVLVCGRFSFGATGDIENALGPQFEIGTSEENYSRTLGISDVSVLGVSGKGLGFNRPDLIRLPPIQLGTLPVFLRPTIGVEAFVEPKLSVDTRVTGQFVTGAHAGVKWNDAAGELERVLDTVDSEASFDSVSAAADAELKVRAGPVVGVAVNEVLPIKLVRAGLAVGPEIDVDWAADRIARDSSIIRTEFKICADLVAEVVFEASIKIASFNLDLLKFTAAEETIELGCPVRRTLTGDLTVTAPDPPIGRVNQSYGPYQLDSNHPATFTVIDGDLPPGLTLNTNGRITGTPTSAGEWQATIRARDALRTAREADITIRIAPAPSPGLVRGFRSEYNLGSSSQYLNLGADNSTDSDSALDIVFRIERSDWMALGDASYTRFVARHGIDWLGGPDTWSITLNPRPNSTGEPILGFHVNNYSGSVSASLDELGATNNVPMFIRCTRIGNALSISTSPNGRDWTAVASQPFAGSLNAVQNASLLVGGYGQYGFWPGRANADSTLSQFRYYVDGELIGDIGLEDAPSVDSTSWIAQSTGKTVSRFGGELLGTAN
jgi:hypothetical protein